MITISDHHRFFTLDIVFTYFHKLPQFRHYNFKSRSFCVAPQVIFTNGATATTLVATTACGIPQKDKIDRIYNRCSGKHLTKNEAFTRLSEIISKGALL
jgi:hypothetical protein